MATKKKEEGKDKEGGDAPSPTPNQNADFGTLLIEVAQLRALTQQLHDENTWLRSIVSKKKR